MIANDWRDRRAAIFERGNQAHRIDAQVLRPTLCFAPGDSTATTS